MLRSRHVQGLIVAAVVLFLGPLLFRPGGLLGPILIQVVLLSEVYALSGKRSTLIVSLALSSAGIIMNWLGVALEHDAMRVTGIALFGLAIAYMTWVFVGSLMVARDVTSDLIASAISAYLMLGLLWAIVYVLLLHFDPAAIRGIDEAHGAIYFSFVTLTTLGYGDVVPVTPMARSLATAEAVVGQLYVAIAIARLIALSLMSESRKA